jgi:hypothetical protein
VHVAENVSVAPVIRLVLEVAPKWRWSTREWRSATTLEWAARERRSAAWEPLPGYDVGISVHRIGIVTMGRRFKPPTLTKHELRRSHLWSGLCTKLSAGGGGLKKWTYFKGAAKAAVIPLKRTAARMTKYIFVPEHSAWKVRRSDVQ